MRTPTAILLALVLCAVGGCALVDGKERVGVLADSWSEADYRGIRHWFPEKTVVLANDADRAAYLAEIPADVERSVVESTDLTDHFLVLGSYSKCVEVSRVWMDGSRTAVWFDVSVPPGGRNTACSWSPLTVDIWRVPVSELDQTPAERLRTEEPS